MLIPKGILPFDLQKLKLSFIYAYVTIPIGLLEAQAL